MSEVQAEQQTEVQPPAEGEQTTNESQESTAAPSKPDHSWVPKRISEITAARRAAEARAAEQEQRAVRAEEELNRLRAADPEGGQRPEHRQSSESFEQLVKARADEIVRQQNEQSSAQQRIKSIEEAGTKEFGEQFHKSIDNLNMAGVGGPEFLKVLTSVPGAEKLVTWMGKDENLNEAMRIAQLEPVQMGIEMMKLAPRAAKDLGKQISKAPPPITTVDGGGGGGEGAEPDPSDTDAWIRWRQKNKKSRR